MEYFPNLVSHNKALSFHDASGWSVGGAGSEPLDPLLMDVATTSEPSLDNWKKAYPPSASISAEGELFFLSSLPAMPSRKTKRHC